MARQTHPSNNDPGYIPLQPNDPRYNARHVPTLVACLGDRERVGKGRNVFRSLTTAEKIACLEQLDAASIHALGLSAEEILALRTASEVDDDTTREPDQFRRPRAESEPTS